MLILSKLSLLEILKGWTQSDGVPIFFQVLFVILNCQVVNYSFTGQKSRFFWEDEGLLRPDSDKQGFLEAVNWISRVMCSKWTLSSFLFIYRPQILHVHFFFYKICVCIIDTFPTEQSVILYIIICDLSLKRYWHLPALKLFSVSDHFPAEYFI